MNAKLNQILEILHSQIMQAQDDLNDLYIYEDVDCAESIDIVDELESILSNHLYYDFEDYEVSEDE